jgi:hypothetical protein
MKRTLGQFILASTLLILLLGSAVPAAFAQAECKANYDEAVGMLASVQKQIDANQPHPDGDQFSQQFQSLVDRMQAQKCLPELLSLIQYIQGEQKKYPPPPGPHPVAKPIVD